MRAVRVPPHPIADHSQMSLDVAPPPAFSISPSAFPFGYFTTVSGITMKSDADTYLLVNIVGDRAVSSTSTGSSDATLAYAHSVGLGKYRMLG